MIKVHDRIHIEGFNVGKLLVAWVYDNGKKVYVKPSRFSNLFIKAQSFNGFWYAHAEDEPAYIAKSSNTYQFYNHGKRVRIEELQCDVIMKLYLKLKYTEVVDVICYEGYYYKL